MHHPSFWDDWRNQQAGKQSLVPSQPRHPTPYHRNKEWNHNKIFHSWNRKRRQILYQATTPQSTPGSQWFHCSCKDKLVSLPSWKYPLHALQSQVGVDARYHSRAGQTGWRLNHVSHTYVQRLIFSAPSLNFVLDLVGALHGEVSDTIVARESFYLYRKIPIQSGLWKLWYISCQYSICSHGVDQVGISYHSFL